MPTPAIEASWKQLQQLLYLVCFFVLIADEELIKVTIQKLYFV